MLTSVCIFIISFVASFLCVATGGAGLIVTPSLILCGIPPQAAVATDIFGMLGSSLAAFKKFRSLGELQELSIPIKITGIGVLGVLAGINVMSEMSAELLKDWIAIIILLGVLLLLCNKRIGEYRHEYGFPKTALIGYPLVFLVGLWGGAIGGGFLILGTFILVLFFGMTLIQSAATLTLLSFTIGVIATWSFAAKGFIHYELGIFVILGKTLGASLGATYATQLNPRVVKYAFSAVTAIVALKLLIE